jgi:ATP-dependent exoDNAse (exonuclease V) beta subunit
MHTPAFSIYNASAGSGKTYTLVKEYLKIILSSKKNDAYRNILAITFTNKAVFEMKSRIVESLFDFSKPNPSEKSISLMQVLQSEINMNPVEIQKKAETIIKNIIHNYAAFDISTIDKFTHKVIRAFAFDLGLPPNFDVTTDSKIILQEAVDAVVARAGEDEILTNLLVDFALSKTDDDKSWDITNDIFTNGELILNENNRAEIDAFKQKSIPEFIELRKNLNGIISDLETKSVVLANEVLQLINENEIEHNSFYSSYIPKHFVKLASGEIIKHIGHYKYLEEGKRYAAKTPQNQKDAIDFIANSIFENFQKINAIAEKHSFYEAALKNLTPLSLLSTISNEIDEIHKDQNILSISEFNKLIFEHIQNQPAPFIYERLGEKYQHFFIDEFQDTSEMQWQNLIPLIDNALAGENHLGIRGSLLIVGDPKQSIYRWRGGKAEQFLDLTKNKSPFSNKDKEVFNLETNFRSFNEIIDFNNSFFSFLSDKFTNADYQKLYKEQSFQLSNNKKGGFISIVFTPEIEKTDSFSDFENTIDEENSEKDQVYLNETLQTIEKVLTEGFSLNEIVILTRNNSAGVLLANFLTSKNIPIISSESLLIDASSEVKLLLDLLRFLMDKTDRESLANALYYLHKNNETNLPTHDFIFKGINFNKQIELEQWLKTFEININFKNLRKKPLYEIVALLAGSVLKPEKNNAYVQFFLDVVLERDMKQQLSIQEFLDFWSKKASKLSIPSSESANAIRIMSIHKSKGLEFPVVIFPFAEENYSAPKKDKMWLEVENEQFDFDKFLVDKSSKVENYGENASEKYLAKKQEDLLDNINVLYVALTRAEEQLHIISRMFPRNKTGNRPNNVSAFLIDFLELNSNFDENKLDYSFGSKKRISKTNENTNIQKTIPQVSKTLKPEAIKIAQKESVMWGTHQQEAIEFGNTIHEILSFIKTQNDFDYALQKALAEGLITTIQKQEVSETIQKIISHPDLAVFFDHNAKILNEQSILKKDHKTLKPDRVSVLGNNCYLLDYKTGIHQEKYKKQLFEYEKALLEIGFSVQKKCIIYIGKEINIVNL